MVIEKINGSLLGYQGYHFHYPPYLHKIAVSHFWDTSQTPVFHTGSLRVHPVEGVYPVKDSSILYQQVSPILVWLSTPDVLLGVFFMKAWGGLPWCLGWNPRPF